MKMNGLSQWLTSPEEELSLWLAEAEAFTKVEEASSQEEEKRLSSQEIEEVEEQEVLSK